jgi:hypothetical protein
MPTGPAFRNEYEQELLAALETFIEHVEEVDLLLAEALLRTNSSEMRVLDEDFTRESPITYLEVVKMYEKFCREARVKWNLPRKP